MNAGPPAHSCGALPCFDTIEGVIEDWAQTGQTALTDWRGMWCVQTKIQFYSGVGAVWIGAVIPQFGFLLGSTVPHWTEGVLHLSTTQSQYYYQNQTHTYNVHLFKCSCCAWIVKLHCFFSDGNNSIWNSNCMFRLYFKWEEEKYDHLLYVWRVLILWILHHTDAIIGVQGKVV